MMETAPVPDIRRHGDQGNRLQLCADLALEWGPRAPRCSAYALVFGLNFERCPITVSVELLLRAVREIGALMVNWINQRGAHSVTELRRAELGHRELQTHEGHRLFFCLINFALKPALLAAAQRGTQPPESPPEGINLDYPSEAASAPEPQESLAAPSSRRSPRARAPPRPVRRPQQRSVRSRPARASLDNLPLRPPERLGPTGR